MEQSPTRKPSTCTGLLHVLPPDARPRGHLPHLRGPCPLSTAQICAFHEVESTKMLLLLLGRLPSSLNASCRRGRKS